MRAEFGNQTVLGLWAVRELAFRRKTEALHVGPKASALMSGVFLVFVPIESTSERCIDDKFV